MLVITVNLTFNSADEMFAFFGPRMAAVAAGAAPAPAPVAAPAEAKRRPGRPPKARPPVVQEMTATAAPAPVIPIPEAVEAAEPVEAEPVDDKVWTEVEVREVMKAFNEKFGIDALRVAIVEATGKGRMSEVPAEAYSKLVARLRAEMGAEKA
jgi:hypothetical protein